MIQILEQKLIESKISFNYVNNNLILPELQVELIPGNKFNSNRRELYDFHPFIIKSPDAGKFGTYLPAIEELKLEIEAYLKHRETVPMTEKIAVLHLKSSDVVYLVEKKITPYSKEVFESLGIHDAAEKLVQQTYERFKDSDIKIDNLGYDEEDSQLKFYDIFPK